MIMCEGCDDVFVCEGCDMFVFVLVMDVFVCVCEGHDVLVLAIIREGYDMFMCEFVLARERDVFFIVMIVHHAGVVIYVIICIILFIRGHFIHGPVVFECCGHGNYSHGYGVFVVIVRCVRSFIHGHDVTFLVEGNVGIVVLVCGHVRIIVIVRKQEGIILCIVRGHEGIVHCVHGCVGIVFVCEHVIVVFGCGSRGDCVVGVRLHGARMVVVNGCMMYMREIMFIDRDGWCIRGNWVEFPRGGLCCCSQA